MDYAIKETSYDNITDLVQEIVDSRAFVERATDDEPFVVEAPEIFGSCPWFRIFAVMDAADRPAGFVMTVPGQESGVLEIGPTYVTRSLRGQGLGQELVTHAITWARCAGVQRLVVATWGRNSRARHVFESAGFSFSGEEPNARVNGDSTVHFELLLPELCAQ